MTGLAGVLFAFHHRFASADPTSISSSGELLAMVIIGGMRSLLGPALGALFYILFREYLSIWTPNWLLFFGLLFVGFVVFSPTGLVGVWRRLTAPLRPPVDRGRGDGGAQHRGRTCAAAVSAAGQRRCDGPVLEARGLAKAFGGTHAVDDASIVVADRTLHALIGPNGAGKTTLFNLVSGLYPPDRGRVLLGGVDITGERRAESSPRDWRARSRSPICFRRFRSRRTCASRCRRATRAGSTAGRARPTLRR